MEKTKIVVLCGSSKFTDVMAVCSWLIEKEERAITMGLHLLPSWYGEKPIKSHLAEYEGVAEQFNELHLRKIDIADEIFVVNVSGYIGDDTRREIGYAESKNLRIRYFTDDPIGLMCYGLIKNAAARSLDQKQLDSTTHHI